MNKGRSLLVVPILLIILTACNRPLLHSKDREMEPLTKVFPTSAPNALKVGREALVRLGYKIETEDESEGLLKTGWRSTKASSHYVDLFDRRDYGTVGAYYQIKLRVLEKEGKAEVKVSAPVRSVVGRLKSSHAEEQKILQKMTDLLRPEDFEMTNVGVPE